MELASRLCALRLAFLLPVCLLAAVPTAHGDPPPSLEDILTATYPDGPLKEASMSAHVARLTQSLDALEAAPRAKQGDHGVPPETWARVEKMLDYVFCSTMPDGQLPVWGDSARPIVSQSLLLRGADLFRREDWRWVATWGKKGKRPAQTSRLFPAAGYAILRSGWDPLANFLALHNGASAARGHADANSLVFSGFGRELLVDPGSAHSSPSAETLAHTSAHNTVTMDDQDTRNAAGTLHFQAGTLLDIVDSTNAGYEGSDPSARHRRRIVFIKPTTFLIVDDATADRPHDWTLRFHFAPGALSYRPDMQQLFFASAVPLPSSAGGTTDPNAADVARLPGGLLLWSQDDRKPVTDLAPVAAGENLLPTPRAAWTISQAKTAHFATLMIPFGEAPAFDQWTIKPDKNGATVVYGPLDNPVTELLRMAPNGGPHPDLKSKLSTGIETDAEVALLRSGPRDPKMTDPGVPHVPYALAVTGATHLSWQGDPRPTSDRPNSAPSQMLFTAAQPVTSLEAIWAKDTLTVTVIGGQDVQICPCGASWLILNGRSRTPIPPAAAFISTTP